MRKKTFPQIFLLQKQLQQLPALGGINDPATMKQCPSNLSAQ
jgi:hypothetical protein